MLLATTSAPTEELLTVDEAKRHLRILVADHDDEVRSLIRAARDACERAAGRTFRTAVTRTIKTSEWWDGCLLLPYPPLLAVSSIAYYDTDNASQTLASTNYHALVSTDAKGRIEWATDATLPALYDRPDAITVTFTTGYATLDDIPPAAVQAIKTQLTELWGDGSEAEIRAAVFCTSRLLGRVDALGYA